MNCCCHVLSLFILHFIIVSDINGQPSFSNQPPSLKNTLEYLKNEIGEDAHLYTGKEYTGYLRNVKGDPYFLYDHMQSGDVFYDGTLYENIPLLYDIVQQEIVINRYKQNFKIKLLNEKIKYFTLAGHRFENLTLNAGNISNGLYEMVFNGKASLLAKREKYIVKGVKAEDLPYIVEEDKFFVENNGFNEVDNKSSLLKALNDKKDLIKTYIRKNKFSFKKNIEKELVMTLAYYSTLNT